MRVILDTDLGMGLPGSEIDDGFALALMVADPTFDIEFVTTVNGNIDVDSATHLSMELLDRLGRPEVPVIRGAARPLTEPDRAHSEPVRELYGHHVPAPGFAAAEIAKAVLAAPGEISVVAIGPLTNIATAIALDPAVATAAREIVIMGGVFLGHTNRLDMPGEFNFWMDPYAAHAVLHSGANLKLVGLDVTLQVRLTRDHAAAMAASGRSFGRYAGECTLAWIDRLSSELPGDVTLRDSCAMHDPLTVATLARTDLVTWQPARVEVSVAAQTRGVAIADLLMGKEPPHPNAMVATAVDSEAFIGYMLNMISTY